MVNFFIIIILTLFLFYFFFSHKKKKLFFNDQVKIIFVLGGPGSGKGTQCQKLSNEHGIVHLSAGELLREEQNKSNKNSEIIKKNLLSGKIVPQEITIKLLKNALQSKFSEGEKVFLIDGFPRKIDQAISFEKNIAKSTIVLFLDCTEKIMLERILERSKASGRDDDNIECAKKRFNTFINTSMEVVDYYREQGRVINIDSNDSVENINKKIVSILKKKKILF